MADQPPLRAEPPIRRRRVGSGCETRLVAEHAVAVHVTEANYRTVGIVVVIAIAFLGGGFVANAEVGTIGDKLFTAPQVRTRLQGEIRVVAQPYNKLPGRRRANNRVSKREEDKRAMGRGSNGKGTKLVLLQAGVHRHLLA